MLDVVAAVVLYTPLVVAAAVVVEGKEGGVVGAGAGGR